MKKLTAILLTTMTAAAVLVGCGSSDSAADSASAQAETAVAATEETTAAAEETADAEENVALTLEEAVANDSSAQEEIAQVKESMDIDIEISGNTMTYKFPLGMDVDEDVKETVAEQLEAGVEEQLESFQSMKEGLEEEVGVTGITLVIVYTDDSGNVIYSRTID